MADFARTVSNLIREYPIDAAWQRDVYEWMHMHPELAMREVETQRRIVEELTRFDCRVITPIGGTGICAVFENGPGKVVLHRADFDALPVVEETGVPYASTNGAMHACGHDIHTTALLSMCDVLDRAREHWSGTFIALFQPAEETGEGAAAMVADGLREKIPAPDICFAQHVMPGLAGEVMSKPGPQFAACDSIRITIPGRSAHGSMPHESIDPTFTAAMIITRLQAIVGREVNPADFAVITVASMHAGSTNNIIPGSAELVLNCRFYSDEVKARVYAAIERVVRAEVVASGIDAQPTISYFAHGELLTNDATVFSSIRPLLDAHFGPRSVTADPKTVSEDFPAIPAAFDVPYFFWLVGCTPEADFRRGNIPVNHMPTFLPDYEPTIRSATEAGLVAVLSVLGTGAEQR
ncbi:amidohydrolase [Corynebacterium riegelii]|uniref:amidohydrolase n=1 Tax=Corynebacterium riegelii TaxID=156976 RepID=UPI00288B0624|nr:amidohydrolase [Corynebacterium riegelii]